ncbi:hypothetical protein GpartN1_g7321.t1 [Galdieria partita]|uniref:Methyltransferase n=1 Tax=Galdieria partita TaxID=83374 RepID=A0A9C7Q3T8_9RHOD|nr:hypothetical protein GpartN1_g7321.t1 [Galdieria partita]
MTLSCCCFQCGRLVVLRCPQKSKGLCSKKRIQRFHILLSLKSRISENMKTLLEKYKIVASDISRKRHLLLSHFEVFDILEYLESNLRETHFIHLEKPLQVHLGCKWVSQVMVTDQGLSLYLESGSVFFSWNTLTDFLGIDSRYRPFRDRSCEFTQGSHKKRSKRISIGNCKIRPGVLLWEEEDALHSQVRRLSFYSPSTKRPITLVPVTRGSPPTVIIGGFTMHRGYSGTRPMDPGLDTQRKIDSLYPVCPKGRVLDICTGLGYTAIELLKRYPDIEQLITIEVDETMVFLEEVNPWSTGLTEESCGIVHRLLGDATKILPKMPDNYFQVVIHDPPAQALQGELYSYDFYCQIARILSPRGQLYHYVGNPNSREAGRLYKGVVDRLHRAGFGSIVEKSQACGVVGIKTN